MALTEKQKQHVLATCVHFRGVQHKTCKAGVEMESMRDAGDKVPYRWPCLPPMIPGQVCATSCPKFQAHTIAQVEARDREIEERIAKMRQLTAECRCNDCEAKIEDTKQVGSCVYALPCRHRIGQGEEKRVRKALGLPPEGDR